LSSYRQRLHTWADSYRTRGWPSTTPEYLLRGYHRMLADTGDLPRMTALAVDPNRHDRMLDVTGGDTAALAEITTTIEAVAADVSPDLSVLGRLAVHRDRLAQRNEFLPTRLAAVWAKLGQPNRGEAIARSITNRYRQVQALTDLAQVVAGAGEPERAAAIVIDAEAIARSITDAHQRALALDGLTLAMRDTSDILVGRPTRADTDYPNRIEQIIQSTTEPDQRAQALSDLAEAAADSGDMDWAATIAADAEQLARTITDPDRQAEALIAVIQVVAAAGDVDRAEQLARSINNAHQQAQAFSAAARAVAGTGNVDRAEYLATVAEQTSRSIPDPDRQADALAAVAGAVAATGDVDRAEQLARSITNPNQQAHAMADLARTVGVLHDRGRRLIVDALRLDRWTTCLTAIHQVQPDASSAIADEFLEHAFRLRKIGTAVSGSGDLVR